MAETMVKAGIRTTDMEAPLAKAGMSTTEEGIVRITHTHMGMGTITEVFIQIGGMAEPRERRFGMRMAKKYMIRK